MDYQVPAGSPSSSAICSAMLPKQPAWTWPPWLGVRNAADPACQRYRQVPPRSGSLGGERYS